MRSCFYENPSILWTVPLVGMCWNVLLWEWFGRTLRTVSKGKPDHGWEWEILTPGVDLFKSWLKWSGREKISTIPGPLFHVSESEWFQTLQLSNCTENWVEYWTRKASAWHPRTRGREREIRPNASSTFTIVPAPAPDSPASVRQLKNGEKTGAHFPVEIKILPVFINDFFPMFTLSSYPVDVIHLLPPFCRLDWAGCLVLKRAAPVPSRASPTFAKHRRKVKHWGKVKPVQRIEETCENPSSALATRNWGGFAVTSSGNLCNGSLSAKEQPMRVKSSSCAKL